MISTSAKQRVPAKNLRIAATNDRKALPQSADFQTLQKINIFSYFLDPKDSSVQSMPYSTIFSSVHFLHFSVFRYFIFIAGPGPGYGWNENA
jgi:hypothetical protein